jgi:hypothetical protein
VLIKKCLCLDAISLQLLSKTLAALACHFTHEGEAASITVASDRLRMLEFPKGPRVAVNDLVRMSLSEPLGRRFPCT